MSVNYMDVEWIPGDFNDRLLTSGSQIKLYKLIRSDNLTDGKDLNGLHRISENGWIELEAEILNPPAYMKCTTYLTTLQNGDVIIGCGQANGRISILGFNPNANNSHVLKEIRPGAQPGSQTGSSGIIGSQGGGPGSGSHAGGEEADPEAEVPAVEEAAEGEVKALKTPLEIAFVWLGTELI